MRLDNTFSNNTDTYLYLERYVNNGSPSGWHKRHTTSLETNPFTGKDRFTLYKFNDDDVRTEITGADLNLFSSFNYAHPDSIRSRILSASHRNLLPTEFLVSPTSGGRTMLIRSPEKTGYLKLTYDIGRIGRVDRQITYKHCLSSYEACKTIKDAIDAGKVSSGFGIQLESSAKTSFLSLEDSTYEWGVIFREFTPYPYTTDDVLLVPGFSLFGKDVNNPSDECLLLQLIEKSNSNPYEYLRKLLIMIVDCYWEIVISCAFHIECHGQNCFFEVDKDYNIRRFVIKDMDSVDKDLPLARQLGLNTVWKSYPIMCFDESIYYYKIRSSYMYDFKLGEYLLSPLIELVTKKYYINPLRIENEIKEYVRTKYLVQLPSDYFPEDGCWYNCDNSERLPGTRRIYYAHENPKYR